MIQLLIASILWAPSFGLVKYNLAGLDSNYIAWIRLMISACVFIVFLRPANVGFRTGAKLMLLGAIQYGLMYMAYTYSFTFLPAYQVALFTIFTPLYVTLLNDLILRRFNRLSLLVALLATAGTAFIVDTGSGFSILKTTLIGFCMVQLSNVCFAAGQIWYKRMAPAMPFRNRDIFGFLYAGAALVTFLPAGLSTAWFDVHLSGEQMMTLLYLGVVPSGIAFFLWNVGATRTSAGTLAVFNNAKIPLAMACAMLIFQEQATHPWRLAIGAAAIILAVLINEMLAPAVAGKYKEENDNGCRAGGHLGNCQP